MIGIVVFVVTLCAACTSGISPTHFEFERGTEGVVPCTAMVDQGLSSEDTESIFWYFSPEESSQSPERIITYFHGDTTHQSAHPEWYDIRNTSLVITNVTKSAEGTYSYRYAQWYKTYTDGSVKVSEKVSYKLTRPKVYLYIDDREVKYSSNPVEVPSDTAELNLTCRVTHAKPAVIISWFALVPVSNSWEEIHAKLNFENVSCNSYGTECFYLSDTINSKVSVKTSLERNNSTFKCVANNNGLEDSEVTIIKTNNDIVTANPQRTTDSTWFGLVEQTTALQCADDGAVTGLSVAVSILTIVVIVLMITTLLLFRRLRLLQIETNKVPLPRTEGMLALRVDLI
ncbi:uncharacterized protein [Asterias amurensis]|uniref:uncharacterized protein n=1 Tax=Asterias amurensis TaxID=7602 RepID=UPI003AB5A990